MSTTDTQTIHVRIPTPLRAYTGDRHTVAVHGRTVGEALSDLTERHPALRQHLYNEEGRLRSFINIYVGDEDIRYQKGEETPLRDEAELSIVPSIAGGR